MSLSLTLHTKQAYNDVRASERRKDAAVNDAQAAYIKTTKHAEADRERNKLIGQGIGIFANLWRKVILKRALR